MKNHSDIIAAIATPHGRGGVGIVRISGHTLEPFIGTLIDQLPQPRQAALKPFRDDRGEEIDRGLVLYFPAPGSYTGEETLELHGHGGPVIMDQLLRRVLGLGARMARPGEFSERAFLNGKLDLAQAEAVADLIAATTEEAARGALRTLKGQFSTLVNALRQDIGELRVYVEAAIDFPEEEIDFLSGGKVEETLVNLHQQVTDILAKASRGRLLKEGIKVVIAGAPNAGKSSLLNALAESDRAIVTDVAGTTRDVLSEQININGLPVIIVDTAGLRVSPDQIEKEGIRRAWQQIADADRILWVVDGSKLATQAECDWLEYEQRYPERDNVTVVLNKQDLCRGNQNVSALKRPHRVVSALTGQGMSELKQHLHEIAGFASGESSAFTARRRHLEALEDTGSHLRRGLEYLLHDGSGELVAEELRQAQQALGQITGEVSSDDLLGEIFASFCVGK